MPKKRQKKQRGRELVVLAGDDGNVYEITTKELQAFKLKRKHPHHGKAKKLVKKGVFHLLVDDARCTSVDIFDIVIGGARRVHFLNMAVSHNEIDGSDDDD